MSVYKKTTKAREEKDLSGSSMMKQLDIVMTRGF